MESVVLDRVYPGGAAARCWGGSERASAGHERTLLSREEFFASSPPH